MLRALCVAGYLVLCLPGLSAGTLNTIPLGDSGRNGLDLNAADNSIHLPVLTHNNVVLDNQRLQQLLAAVGRLEKDNLKLRLDVKRTHKRMTGLIRAHRTDNDLIWKQLRKNAAQVKGCRCSGDMADLQQRVGDVENVFKLVERPSARGPAFYLSGLRPIASTSTNTTAPTDSVVLQGTKASSVLVTKKGTILIADQAQQEVLVTSLQHVKEVLGRRDFGLTPWSMAQLGDRTVAVTWVEKPQISILRIAKGSKRVRVIRTIATDRKYRGVTQCGGQGGEGSFLIVSTYRESSVREARIDVITQDGVVQESLLSGKEFEDLLAPFYLTCRHEDELYVSDWSSHRVFVLNVTTRLVTSTFGKTDLTDLDLYRPRQVTFDLDQNMYLVTGGGVCGSSSHSDDERNKGGRCIVQVTSDGRWRSLFAVLPADKASDSVSAVSVANTNMVIASSAESWENSTRFTKLAVYDLRMSEADDFGWNLQQLPANAS